MQQGGLQVLYVLAHFCQYQRSYCLNCPDNRHTRFWHRARFWCKPITYWQYVTLLFDERGTDNLDTILAGSGTSGLASLRSTSNGMISASLLLSFVVGAVMFS
jgi:hypothetical protein